MLPGSKKGCEGQEALMMPKTDGEWWGRQGMRGREDSGHCVWPSERLGPGWSGLARAGNGTSALTGSLQTQGCRQAHGHCPQLPTVCLLGAWHGEGDPRRNTGVGLVIKDLTVT